MLKLGIRVLRDWRGGRDDVCRTDAGNGERLRRMVFVAEENGF